MRDFYSRLYQLYFEYGSNMNHGQITSRCLKPEVFSIARLINHKISFFGYSKKWDGGEESLIGAPGEDLWGVIYKLSFSDADRLDAWQDVRLDGNGSHFLYPADVIDINGTSFPVLIIKKNVLGNTEKPSVEYLDHIVSGARFHSLPSAYIENLKSIPARKAAFPVPVQSTFDRSVLAGLSCDCGAAESIIVKNSA